ncbi:MAG: hypothetical protein LBN97_07380, partial [Oscillospiraceae bacterium]|nr:hypothetical protein [Oscillospiraceae bacterium]
MTFYEMIDSKVMPEIRKGGTDEFIVYRDTEQGWQCDFTQNQFGETCDWVAEVKSADPFAEIFSGASLQSISG